MSLPRTLAMRESSLRKGSCDLRKSCAASGANFAASPEVAKTMDKVRKFAFEKRLFG